MKRGVFGILLLLVVVFSSCVPRRKVVLLQDGLGIEGHTIDSVTQQYDLRPYVHHLEIGDIITVRIGSLSPSEYDFVKEYEQRLGVYGQLLEYSRFGGQSQGNQQNQGGGAAAAGIDNPFLQQLFGFKVDADGAVELPYVGNVEVVGLTTDEAAKKIREALLEFFKKPLVRVQLANYHFSVFGEVTKPGRYTTYADAINVNEALLMAGGLGEFADRTQVKVVRSDSGRAQVFYLNLLDERLLGSPNYYLQPGDMLVVPPLKAKVTRNYTLPNFNLGLSILSTGLSLYLLILNLRP